MGTRTLSLLLFGAMSLGVSAEEAPRFNRDIRPVLSDNCFACHGPDANKRKGGLRLDTPEGAAADGAIVPGNPAASVVYQRITSTDPEERMPPVDTEHVLSEAQIALLERWIASGAAYEPHWSLVPLPAKAAAAVVDDPAQWIRNGIDSHVLKRLQAEGLSPSVEADKETLLRRASMDLTGLPPTVEEMDAFLADTAPDAYERAVERLLASPVYGERMALDWLDVARYADTFGYQADVEMNVWPWRDWVIKAFNENLPYDDFITWQLAGDLLPNATQEQRLATAFNRLHRQTNEGGSINEEFRAAYIGDRTETFSTAFLGLTMSCARCHDHKFDPISQKDYFSLSAFFANIDESGLYSHFTVTSPTPALLLYKEREQERHEMLKGRIARLAGMAKEAELKAAAGFDAWLANPQRELAKQDFVLGLDFEEATENRVTNLANKKQPGTFIISPQFSEGVSGKALSFSGDDGLQCEEAASFERNEAFTLATWIRVEQHIPKAVVMHRSKAETDAASRGYEVLLDEGRPVFSLVHFWPGNAIRIRAKAAIAEKTWVHLAARYDGSSTAAGCTLYVNGVAVESEVVRDNLYKTIRYEDDPKTPFTLAQRFRDNGLKGGALDEVMVYRGALSPLEIEALSARREVAEQVNALVAEDSKESKEKLKQYYVARVDGDAGAARAKVADARATEAEFVETVPTIMTMEEQPQPRDTFILTRGEYDKPTDKVSADTPAGVLPFPADQPRNRLGLAHWLTDPRHPLTARVTVNRYWQVFFGKGLVETPEDFGSQGRAPVNPELLDYLARSFIESGWDVKDLCKRIVTSATYRQDSKASPELRNRDPYNQLLARGAHFRLSAEQIRDSALAGSGLLTRTIGGPSVKPYQPEGLWEDSSHNKYVLDEGPGLYRRGMYTYIKRTLPPPSVQTFDGTSREVCVVRRERTMTPLQALVLLNDPQYVEAARVLAERVLAAAPDASSEARVETIFRTLINRRPRDAERGVLEQALEEQQAWFAAHADDAMKYARAGKAPANEALDPVEVAATSALAQAVIWIRYLKSWWRDAPSPHPSPPMGARGKEGVVTTVGDWLSALAVSAPSPLPSPPMGARGKEGRRKLGELGSVWL